ncbi:MAG: ATP cone domain-containing protein [Methanobacteriaceae archaeon]|nr:ATP cone domain-containing protein [Methanobacteriaceae archaeon]
MKVVKKRGTIESYQPSKIKKSLEKAAIDAGYSVEEKKNIINKVYSNINQRLEDKKEIKTDTIRGCLLTELDKCEPYIAKSWRRFENKYKK